MNVTRRDLDRAVERGVLSEEQARRLWEVLAGESRGGGGRFDLPHVAYYLGALVVLTAMGWFMSLGYENFGAVGLTVIALAYGALFGGVGGSLWRRPGLMVPGGLLVTIAVCMTPLAVYGAQEALGVWPEVEPGDYGGLYGYLTGGWFAMEAATVVAGLVALLFVRFPFVVVPVISALYLAAIDVTPLIYGERYPDVTAFATVSLVFGVLVVLGAYLVDRRTEEDYAAWGYLLGVAAFWGGLTAQEGGTEWEWAVYGGINLALVLLSVLLQRRVFVAFGSVGVFAYVGHLAWEIFEDSLLFPFVLSAAGLGIIALGIFYARNRERIEGAVVRAVPERLRRLLPAGREAV